MTRYIQDFWQKHTVIHGIFYPLMWIYQLVVMCRRWVLTHFFTVRFDIPIVVVGNITTGGVGKTPLVIALVHAFLEKGLRVAVVSRGYKAHCQNFPREVLATDSAFDVGDEPLLIALKTNVPVIISPDRVSAIRYALKNHCPDVIVSDDGLQHYRMGRSIEIAVVDGIRLLGNGRLLPVGPLRESPRRLNEVDFLIVNGGQAVSGHQMHLKAGAVTALKGGSVGIPKGQEHSISAVAGIGHPERFFATLTDLSYVFDSHSFPDHHAFSAQDFKNMRKIILMTEKDAVKCRAFATDSMYFLPVHAVLEQSFWDALWAHPALVNLKGMSPDY